MSISKEVIELLKQIEYSDTTLPSFTVVHKYVCTILNIFSNIKYSVNNIKMSIHFLICCTHDWAIIVSMESEQLQHKQKI